jgi:predicted SprT family Zn-dependent metalloprotease
MTPGFERRTLHKPREFASPRCRDCGSADTEPVTTMRRHTCDADDWYRCGECERVFTVSRIGEP